MTAILLLLLHASAAVLAITHYLFTRLWSNHP